MLINEASSYPWLLRNDWRRAVSLPSHARLFPSQSLDSLDRIGAYCQKDIEVRSTEMPVLWGQAKSWTNHCMMGEYGKIIGRTSYTS
jgi:hypothetical protein